MDLPTKGRPTPLSNILRRGQRVLDQVFNRIIKQTKRVGCGFRNMDNYQRRILTHIAITRPRQAAA